MNKMMECTICHEVKEVNDFDTCDICSECANGKLGMKIEEYLKKDPDLKCALGKAIIGNPWPCERLTSKLFRNMETSFIEAGKQVQVVFLNYIDYDNILKLFVDKETDPSLIKKECVMASFLSFCGGEGNMEIYSTSMLPRGRALFADLDNNYFVVTDKTSDTKTTNKGE